MHRVAGMASDAPLWDVVKRTISGCGKAHRHAVCLAAQLQEVAKCTVAGCKKVDMNRVAGMVQGAPLWDVD